MKNIIFFIFIFIFILCQSCSIKHLTTQTNERFPLRQIGRTSFSETNVDTTISGDKKVIFVYTKQTDTVWYEDSLKIYKMRRQLDSVVNATYLVTSTTARFQQKHQKECDFYKGISFVTGSMIVVTGIWWLIHGM